jgi:7-carboxy-7-deazaguanine synthase
MKNSKALSQSYQTALPVMEHFYTIQGEGFNTGLACYFIRLGGCDVGCVWCDVKESWNASNHPVMEISDLIQLVSASKAKRVVITGGEPLMYDLTELTNQLQQSGIKLFLETSGAYPLTGNWDWICVSPKKFKPPQDEVLKKADELKIVVYNKSDFQWAEEHHQKVSLNCKLFLQPEFGESEQVTPMIIDYVKEHPEWRISLQTHKIIRVP